MNDSSSLFDASHLDELARQVRAAVSVSMWVTGEKYVDREGNPAHPWTHDEYDQAMASLNELVLEIKRLRQGLWDVATITGMDTDGNAGPDHMVFPDIVDLAVREVTRLREDYDNA